MSESCYGLFKTTLLDYPGRVASTVFTLGCNLRCPYCHNPDFVFGKDRSGLLSWGEIISFLQKRSKIIGGVCITGGEPLIHNDLPEKIEQIHSLGLPVKLDTNGTFPEKLQNLNVDYIAMDIKTDIGNYINLGYTGKNNEISDKIKKSIQFIKNSKIRHHFRTTVVPNFVNEGTIKEIITLVEGEKEYVLQSFRPDKTLDPSFSETIPYSPERLNSMKNMFISAGIECILK